MSQHECNSVIILVSIISTIVNLETNALITAATLKYFELDNLDAKVEGFIPSEILKYPRENGTIWLHSHE